MSEDLRMTIVALLVLTLLTSGIQWLLIRFTHWSIALIISALLAFFVSFLYVSLSHATPNGAGYNIRFSEYILPIIIVFAAFSFSFCLVSYFSKTNLPKITYLVPIGLLFSMIVLFFISVNNANKLGEGYASELCVIEVINETGTPPVMHHINFRNNENSYDLGIDMKKNNDVNALRNENDIRYFPIFTNEIEFVFISNTSALFFSQKFPFDYRIYREDKIDLQDTRIHLKIILKSNSKVAIYLNENLVIEYQLEELENN